MNRVLDDAASTTGPTTGAASGATSGSVSADDLDRVVELLAGKRIAVLSGAGLSTDSGIPDYRGTGIVFAVAVLLVIVRFAFLNAAGGTIWLVTRRTGGEPREGHRDRLVSGFAGFRGAVSLAMAVAVPRTLESGGGFPERDLIVFVTAGVVIVTIVGQALVLPAVLRRAALPEDESVSDERRYAERTAIEEALDALPRLARSTGADRATVARLRKDYEAHLDVIEAREGDDDDHPALQRHDNAVALELALVQHKAKTLLRLRDADEIDDLVLRQVRAGYDAEEARLDGIESVASPPASS